MPMSLATFGDFLRTQSATERYRDVVGEDPVPHLRGSRRGRLGRPRRVRDVIWPIFIGAGRLRT